MNLSKSELRDHFKKKRRLLSAAELEESSKKIAEIVKGFCESHSKLNHFHIFLPIQKLCEINTYYVKDFLLSNKKTVYTSHLDSISNEMETISVGKHTEFEEDIYGIPIPKILKPADFTLIEVVFVPLLVVDQFGNRIGYGKGYYDRFLANLDPKVLKIGLSIFEPIPLIAKESFDIPLDYCITPKNMINYSSIN